MKTIITIENAKRYCSVFFVTKSYLINKIKFFTVYAKSLLIADYILLLTIVKPGKILC